MKKTNKTIISCAVATLLVVATILIFARCSDTPKEEPVKIPDTTKSSTSTAQTNPDQTTKAEPKTTPENTDSTSTGKQVDSAKPETTYDTSIPESTLQPSGDTQLKTAMRLIPESSFDEDPNTHMGILIYANMRDCFKRMNYDFGKDIEKIASMSPPFIYTAFTSPLNDFERPKNWIWTISNVLTSTFWCAGDFNVNMNLSPMLKKEKYKQFPLIDMYAYFLAPEDAQNLRYTTFVAPIANSFAMFSVLDASDIARKTAINASAQGQGMLGNPEYLKILSYLGEPEACALTRNTQDNSKMIEAIDNPQEKGKGVQQVPKELKESFLAVRNKRRPKTLKYIATGFYPKDEYALKIFLVYDDVDAMRADFPVCKSVWDDPKVVFADKWRKMSKLSDSKFSVKENIGIIECKVDSSMPGIDVINKFSMVLGINSVTPLMKQ